MTSKVPYVVGGDGFRIWKGGYWFQGENSWGQYGVANVYETERDARRVLRMLHDRGEWSAEVRTAASPFVVDGPELWKKKLAREAT